MGKKKKRPHSSNASAPTPDPSNNNDFVRRFIRSYVKPSNLCNVDIGSSFAGDNPNLNLTAPAAKRPRSSRGRSYRNLHKRCSRLSRNLTGVASVRKSQVGKASQSLPIDMIHRLHQLWVGYARSALANLSPGNSLEPLLRANLIGAKMRVMRSMHACPINQDFIVVMESKHMLHYVLMDDRSKTAKSSPTILCPVRRMTKLGSLFLLDTSQWLSVSQEVAASHRLLLLVGDQLLHRPIDRAVRKWRLPSKVDPGRLLLVNELLT